MNRDIVLVFVSALVATVNPSLLAATAVMMLLPERKRLMTGYLLGNWARQQGESALLASTFAPTRTEDVIVGVKGWFARHGRQVAMVGLFAVGALLAARGALTVS